MGILKNIFGARKSNLPHKPSTSARKKLPLKAEKKLPATKFSIVITAVTAVLIVWGAYSINILYQTPRTATDDFVVGQKVHKDIYAQVTFDFNDLTQTAIKEKHELSKVLDIYRIDDATNDIIHQYFVELFRIIKLQAPRERAKVCLGFFESVNQEYKFYVDKIAGQYLSL